jgi:hypothetical protein
MSSKMSLNDVLWHDEHSFQSQLLDRLVLQGKTPAKLMLIVRFSDGVNAERDVLHDTIETPPDKGIDQLVRFVEGRILSVVGRNPTGRVHIRCYAVGESSSKDWIQITRTVIPAQVEDDAANSVVYKTMLIEERARNARLEELLLDRARVDAERQKADAETIRAQAVVIATLGTQRAQGAYSADMGAGGLVGILASYLMGTLTAEAAKAALGLPKDATTADIWGRAQAALGALRQPQLAPGKDRPPPLPAGAQRPQLEDAKGRAQLGTATEADLAVIERSATPQPIPAEAPSSEGAAPPAQAPPLRMLLELAERDPELARELCEGIGASDVLSSVATEVYFSGNKREQP